MSESRKVNRFCTLMPIIKSIKTLYLDKQVQENLEFKIMNNLEIMSCKYDLDLRTLK